MKLGSITKFAFVSILMIGNIKPATEAKQDGPEGSFTFASAQWTFGINDAFAGFGGDYETTAPWLDESRLEWEYDHRWEQESGDANDGGGGGTSGEDNRTDAEIAADKALCDIEAREENVICLANIATNVNTGMQVCNTASNFVEALAGFDMVWAIPLFREVSNCDELKIELRKTSEVRCAAFNRTNEEWCVYVNQP